MQSNNNMGVNMGNNFNNNTGYNYNNLISNNSQNNQNNNLNSGGFQLNFNNDKKENKLDGIDPFS